jgi:hypothetical protein
MVKGLIKNKIKYYVCEECDMVYYKEIWAKKCEAWCRKYKSCNVKIISHSISNKVIK